MDENAIYDKFYSISVTIFHKFIGSGCGDMHMGESEN
jgi:hypothetical protein